jgi:hypothetical protein
MSAVDDLMNQLGDHLQTGIQHLSVLNESQQPGHPAANALYSLNRAQDAHIDLAGAIAEEQEDQDQDSAANTGNLPRSADAPSKRVGPIHLISGVNTRCGLPWVGKPEHRLSADSGVATCKECRRKAAGDG